MARRFRFRLQPLLEHRERIEDEQQQAVALRQQAYDRATAELDRLDTEFRNNSARLRGEHRSYNAEDLRLSYAHLQFLDRAIVAQIHVVAERRLELDRARTELLAASRDRKVVEKLKTRRREAFNLEEFRVEQNELDDSNARQFGRSEKVGGTP